MVAPEPGASQAAYSGYRGAMPGRSLIRIAVNIVLDGILAAIAVPLARWIANPGAALFPGWLPPAGAAAVLLAGLPFGLSLQYWRFIGMGELLAVAGASLLGAGLLSIAMAAAGIGFPSHAFPFILALMLMALLAAPRILYERRQARPLARSSGDDATGSALLVGAGEDTDLFLRALAQDRRQGLRVTGLLSLGTRQTGRRIQGQPILGSIDDAAAVLARLHAEGRLPRCLIVATPDVAGPRLAALLEQADRYGMVVRRAPRPTALDPATRPIAPTAEHALDLRPIAIEDLLNRA
ncbi:MAG: polysaccharide biosynthesis protein, partial [Acetobacteraceae bacterium]